MKKEEFIEKRGEEAWKRAVNRSRQWRTNDLEKVKAQTRDQSRKGGKRYSKRLKYNITGLRHERNKIRKIHQKRWSKYKKIIAPDSQLHHQWLPGTAEYSGLALVEKEQHMHGFIDVVKILDGTITLFTEKEIREQGAGACQ